MEILRFFSALVSFFLLIIFLFKYLSNPKKPPPPRPPSPAFSLPILGHLHLLKKPLHRCLSHLSHRYGPVLRLQFGSRAVLAVSSPSALQQCFTTNDIVFANRPRLLAGKHLGYNYTNLAWASYGARWRNLRRVTTIEIFSSNRINAFSGVRNEEAICLVRKLCGGSDVGFRKVELRQVFFELVLNVMMRIAAGKRYYGAGGESDWEEARRFREIVEETFLVSAATNFLDFLPVLRWVGFGGGEKRIEELQKKRNEFLQGLIDERRRTKSCSPPIGGEEQGEGEGEGEGKGKKKKTLLDAVLALHESDPEYYTDEILKGILVIMFTAGTDTTTLTMEWAMSLLLNHPDVLSKARREIDSNVKQYCRVLEESDLPSLPYLHCIINETMRLYPVGPILVPHESSEECTVGGFTVPRGTMLLPNVWALQRDPDAWDRPTLFRPERFEEEGDLKEGDSCRFMPFGLGRRSCPGAAMAMRIMGLVLGVLIQCFEWERVGGEDVDMEEQATGLTLRKAKPLEAMYKPRESMMDVLSQL